MSIIPKYKIITDYHILKKDTIGIYFEKDDIYVFIGTVNNKYKNAIIYSSDFCKSYPNLFKPYLFTTDDNVDIFDNDILYAVDSETIFEYRATKNENDNVDYKRFSTKEAAEQYLELLKPKFKVNDIVVCENYSDLYDNKPLQITKIVEDFNKDYYYFEPCSNKNHNFCDYNKPRKATNNEIIKFYENQGWVRGAKIKSGGDYDTIDKLIFIKDQLGVVFKESREWKEIYACELIKEVDHPNSFSSIFIRNNDDLLVCINDLIKLYGIEEFKKNCNL